MTGRPSYPSRQHIQTIENKLYSLARQAGFAPVLLNVLQPADIFIDLSGENLRQRLCLIEQEGGERQCLRPDFTIPTGLNYVASVGEGGPKPQKISYAGPVYRRQQDGTPEEISQVGLESFSDMDREAADVEILSFTLEALSTIGVKAPRLMIGDLGLFRALLEAIDMPQRWRNSLCGAIWQPAKFDRLLNRISQAPQPIETRDSLLASIDELSVNDAQAMVARQIEQVDGMIGNILPGNRTLEDITARLMAQAKDASAYPLPKETADLVRIFLKLKGKPADVLADITNLCGQAGLPMGQAIDRFSTRLAMLENKCAGIDNIHFSTEFGRALEYYTGFVFEVTDGNGRTLVGGGRYDTLLAQLGLQNPLPAVGCAFKVANVAALVEGAS